jgi:RNA polymerase sigma factor (sigma-70 family)
MSDPTTLAQVLESLPEEERIILTLHYLKSMSSQEIAAMLHVPTRSVEGVISSGKTRLRAILGL